MGGLAWQSQRDAVRRHFEQFGEIAEAVVIADKHTGRSRGYGFVRYSSFFPQIDRRSVLHSSPFYHSFMSPVAIALLIWCSVRPPACACQVTFRDPEAAARALQDPTPVIDGRRANCNLAALGASQRLHPAGSAAPVGIDRFLSFPVRYRILAEIASRIVMSLFRDGQVEAGHSVVFVLPRFCCCRNGGLLLPPTRSLHLSLLLWVRQNEQGVCWFPSYSLFFFIKITFWD